MRKATLSLLTILPLLWLGLTAATLLSGHPWTDNEKAVLNAAAKSINKFKDAYGRVPDTIAEIRAFSKSQKNAIAPYDSYGQRLDYLTLGDEAFILTSYGRDEQANTLTSKADRTLLQGVDATPAALESIFPSESKMHFYQGAFLEGLAAPATHLVAKLWNNPRSAARRIVVKDPKRPQFVMTSTHDAVEEFLWLPSGHELIFTAFGSERYEDGIYYWNLETNSTHNFVKALRNKFFADIHEDEKLVFSLSHIGGKPQFAYFFAAPLHGADLNPKEFYRYGNFFAIDIKGPMTTPEALERVPAEQNFTIFDYGVNHRYLIAKETEKSGSELQKEWLDLPLEGHPETLILAWQTFCSNHSANTPIQPYGLWWLASLYNDTYRYLKVYKPSQATPVKNFGIEISEALANLPTAPIYKRAMAEYLKKILLLSQVADYNVASMWANPSNEGGE